MEKKIYLYDMDNDIYICCNVDLAFEIIKNNDRHYLIFNNYDKMKNHVGVLKNKINNDLIMADIVNNPQAGEYIDYKGKIKKERGLI